MHIKSNKSIKRVSRQTKIITFAVAVLCLLVVIQYNPAVTGFLTEALGYPAAISQNTATTTPDVLYIFGGHPISLDYKFKKVARFLNDTPHTRILVLSRPGITEYEPALGRNFTNNEWAIKKLVDYGINPDDIFFLEAPSGFLGTYSEATTLAAWLKKKKLHTVTACSSAWHGRRVMLTLSNTLSTNRTVFFCPQTSPWISHQKA